MAYNIIQDNMKTLRMIGAAVVAAVFAFAMSSCEKDNKDEYKDYPQLIVGKWFCFTPESSIFMNYQADGTFYQVGYASKNGWREYVGTYEILTYISLRRYCYGIRILRKNCPH